MLGVRRLFTANHLLSRVRYDTYKCYLIIYATYHTLWAGPSVEVYRNL